MQRVFDGRLTVWAWALVSVATAGLLLAGVNAQETATVPQASAPSANVGRSELPETELSEDRDDDGATSASTDADQQVQVSGMPARPKTPASIRRVLAAQAVSVEQPFEHRWRKDRPKVRSGWLLALEVDPALVFPRQAAEPVLYVADTTADRLHSNPASGVVIAFAPVATLVGEPIWFGEPTMPEAVDRALILEQRRLIGLPLRKDDKAATSQSAASEAAAERRRSEYVPPSLDAAIEAGGGQALKVADHAALVAAAQQWVTRFDKAHAQPAGSEPQPNDRQPADAAVSGGDPASNTDQNTIDR